MKRQRYERTDVPKGGPRGAIMGVIALVLIAVGGWFLVQTLWAKARFDSAKGDAELVSSVSGTPELKSVDGYTVSDHSFNNTLILIVDDVISTGESLAALEALVEKAGGEIVGRMAILAEGDAQDREDIIYLEKLPLFNAKGEVIG